MHEWFLLGKGVFGIISQTATKQMLRSCSAPDKLRSCYFMHHFRLVTQAIS